MWCGREMAPPFMAGSWRRQIRLTSRLACHCLFLSSCGVVCGDRGAASESASARAIRFLFLLAFPGIPVLRDCHDCAISGPAVLLFCVNYQECSLFFYFLCISWYLVLETSDKTPKSKTQI